MQKAIVYRAYNGMEIIDARPEAEIAYSNMKYAEELYANKETKLNHIKVLRRYCPHYCRRETNDERNS